MEELLKEFTPYEQALELKELGFDGYSFAFYQSDRLKQEKILSGTQKYMREEDCKAPTFSQAFRWFREKYGLHGYCTQPNENNNYWGHILSFKAMFSTYEEAELNLLKQLIEIAKTK